jgi:hypothetical protein
MGLKFSDLSAVRDVESDGEWVDFAAGVRLLVRPIGCEAYDQFIASNLVPGPDGDLIIDEKSDLQKRALAETILLGWSGVTDDAGEPLQFTADRAIEALRASYPFVKQVLLISQDLRRREDARWRDAEGKSETMGGGGALSETGSRTS